LAGEADVIATQTRTHQRGWLIVTFTVGALSALDCVVNPGYPVSAISLGTRDVLGALGHLEHTGGRLYRLLDLSLEGQALPNLHVRSSPAVDLLGVEGVIGLNFFRQFREVCFHVPSGRLTLRR
jgi:hypothetical protein